MIYKEISTVIETNEIADGIFQSRLISPKISSESKPGQFINILPSINWQQIMRRPMSISSQGNGEISIIYKVVGEGTRLMKNWKENEKVDLIGPLGNYWTGFEDTFPVLIGGGVGIAPILNLHHHLQSIKIEHILIMGAHHKGEHFIPHEPENSIYLSSDDGSVGIEGNVLDALNIIFNTNNSPSNIKLFSCGPPLMMEGVREYSIQNRIRCDFALETIMACGYGICQGCTIEKHTSNMLGHSYRNRFALACIDGPIFNGEEIVRCM